MKFVVAAVAAVANADAVAAAAGVQSVIKANPCNFNDDRYNLALVLVHVMLPTSIVAAQDDASGSAASVARRKSSTDNE